jgi:hypothetical protein
MKISGAPKAWSRRNLTLQNSHNNNLRFRRCASEQCHSLSAPHKNPMWVPCRIDGESATFKSNGSPRNNGYQLKLLNILSGHLESERQDQRTTRQSPTWRTQAHVAHQWQLSRMPMSFTPTLNCQSLKEVGSKGSCGRRRSAHAIPSKARLCSLRLADSEVWATHSSVTTLVSSTGFE